ncbi:unnamed protein product [Mycena citricolor]|uniref:Uncharacterized protein n=1 Tax=Mycena citricolor TaxID=2018698 RepID=A0AAD2GSM1_9AGAR|nr:unnamed protein product [Mycena citricolor]CAK5277853.1 unnamed protein product [Mycena citricolor]
MSPCPPTHSSALRTAVLFTALPFLRTEPSLKTRGRGSESTSPRASSSSLNSLSFPRLLAGTAEAAATSLPPLRPPNSPRMLPKKPELLFDGAGTLIVLVLRRDCRRRKLSFLDGPALTLALFANRGFSTISSCAGDTGSSSLLFSSAVRSRSSSVIRLGNVRCANGRTGADESCKAWAAGKAIPLELEPSAEGGGRPALLYICC